MKASLLFPRTMGAVSCHPQFIYRAFFQQLRYIDNLARVNRDVDCDTEEIFKDC